MSVKKFLALLMAAFIFSTLAGTIGCSGDSKDKKTPEKKEEKKN